MCVNLFMTGSFPVLHSTAFISCSWDGSKAKDENDKSQALELLLLFCAFLRMKASVELRTNDISSVFSADQQNYSVISSNT